MSVKYTLHYSKDGLERDLAIEDFTDAIVCEGYVFLRERVEHSISTAAGQCWGEYVDFPAGSFLDGEFMPRSGSLCIDSPGDEYIITEIVSLDPLRIESRRHVGVEPPTYGEEPLPYLSRHIATLSPKKLDSHSLVDSFGGAAHTLLIPAAFDDASAVSVNLLGCDLSEVETLIISKGVSELAVDFSSAEKLRRLFIPDDVKLLCPLDYISTTPWFRALPHEPLYISDCYCGTPGGGSGEPPRSLSIPEGITSVAAAADFHCYWHSIKTPESLLSIGRLAFSGCHCLEELNFSEGIFSLGDDAFHTLPRLRSLWLPRSLQEIGKGCFSRSFYLESVSLFHEEHAERFNVHSLSLRQSEKHISKCPPFVISLTDRISSFPPQSPFTAAVRSYRSCEELSLHPLGDFGFEYLDVHGQRVWRIAVRDDCRRGRDGEKLLVERWFIKSREGVTQVEKTADGTVLVRENINLIDVDYALRNIAAREVFDL